MGAFALMLSCTALQGPAPAVAGISEQGTGVDAIWGLVELDDSDSEAPEDSADHDDTESTGQWAMPPRLMPSFFPGEVPISPRRDRARAPVMNSPSLDPRPPC